MCVFSWQARVSACVCALIFAMRSTIYVCKHVTCTSGISFTHLRPYGTRVHSRVHVCACIAVAYRWRTNAHARCELVNQIDYQGNNSKSLNQPLQSLKPLQR